MGLAVGLWGVFVWTLLESSVPAGDAGDELVFVSACLARSLAIVPKRIGQDVCAAEQVFWSACCTPCSLARLGCCGVS